MSQDIPPISPDPSVTPPVTPPPAETVPPPAGAAPYVASARVSTRSPDGTYIGSAPTPDDRTMGMLAHLLGIFTAFIGPLIIWLMKKDQSPFVDDQGKEALNFQIFAFICFLGCLLFICIPVVNLLVIFGFHAVRIVFGVLAAIEANKGVAYRYPINLRLIK